MKYLIVAYDTEFKGYSTWEVMGVDLESKADDLQDSGYKILAIIDITNYK